MLVPALFEGLIQGIRLLDLGLGMWDVGLRAWGVEDLATDFHTREGFWE